MFHTLAWVIWLVAAAVSAFTLHNPLYLGLVLGAAWIVYVTLGRTSPLGSSWGGFVKIGLFFLLLTIPFNALSIHSGRVVLFHVPEGWPIVGGAITLEAVLSGAANGLSLLTILVVFAAFNAVADHYQLLRATPAFLFHAGVVVSIAITFVPQMILSGREIREAQRIRGHRFRGIRDLLPLVIPLLANALERAIQLAETMEARGFGSTGRPASRREGILIQSGLLAALLAILSGLFVVTYLPASGPWGWALAVGGLAGLLAIFWRQGQHVKRSHYHQDRWTAGDSAIAAAGAAVVAAVIAAKLLVPEVLIYSPYPPYSLLPPFNPWVGMAMLLLAVPAVVSTGHEQRTTHRREVPQ
jgi:energy-coupling factor transport system permease protein